MASSATPEPTDTRPSRAIVLTIGAGSGMALATAILQLVHPNAEPIAQAVLQWGPLFVLTLVAVILGYHLLESWGARFVGAVAANATAMQSMADSMQRISTRQDERDRERELALDHLAATTQRILAKLEAIEERQVIRESAGGIQE